MAERAMLDRVAFVREWYEGMPEELTAIREDQSLGAKSIEVLTAVADPDFETVLAGGRYSVARGFRGVDGYISAWGDWLQAWESYRSPVEGYLEGRDCVLVLAIQQGVPRGGSTAVESEAAAVWFFEGDRLTRVEFHLDRAAGLEAAGLA